MSALELPEQLSGPRSAGATMKMEAPAPGGHFLAVIAFDGHVTAETVDAIMMAQVKHHAWRGWKIHIGEGQVRARNECVNEFLHKTPCSHLLFHDADVIPRAEHILGMRKHPEAADSIICGLYAKKQPKIEYPYNSLKGGNPEPNSMHLMEVAKGPTGFMQIPRSAFLKIQAKFPERFYLCDYNIDALTKKRESRYSFFFHDIRKDQELGFMRDQSEDWAFCEMAREAGVKIYVDCFTTAQPTAEQKPIMHVGRAYFPLFVELERRQAVDAIEEWKKKVTELEQKLSGMAKAAVLTP